MAKTDKISEQKLYGKKCLEIVESCLNDEDISVDQLFDNCLYITRSHYTDIVTERSLIDLCGYPVCRKKLSESRDKFRFNDKQKYKIDTKNNKIFEIEDRKQFCSNLCFKASNYLKEQISEEAIYLRTGPQQSIRLYEKDGQSGNESVTDENLIRQTDVTEEIPKIKTKVENKKLLSNDKQKQLIGFPYVKEEHLSQLEDQMKDLTIKERFVRWFDVLDDSDNDLTNSSEDDENEAVNEKKNKKTVRFKTDSTE